MTDRIAGPLGTERGWSHVIEQHQYQCHLCHEQIGPGRMMAKDGAHRHAGCHIRAQHATMSPAEQIELMQRIHDLAYGEHPEDADNDPDQMLCPSCGAPEVEAATPRTTYACGSSDYDQRPGTFTDKCSARATT